MVGDELAGKLGYRGGLREIAGGRGHICKIHHTSYFECTIRSVVIIRRFSAVEKCIVMSKPKVHYFDGFLK